eukprot:15160165-Alexandrium_andersonii.AAC.1
MALIGVEVGSESQARISTDRYRSGCTCGCIRAPLKDSARVLSKRPDRRLADTPARAAAAGPLVAPHCRTAGEKD